MKSHRGVRGVESESGVFWVQFDQVRFHKIVKICEVEEKKEPEPTQAAKRPAEEPPADQPAKKKALGAMSFFAKFNIKVKTKAEVNAAEAAAKPQKEAEAKARADVYLIFIPNSLRFLQQAVSRPARVRKGP